MESINSQINKETMKEDALTPAELVRKHILDPNHVVTDDELMNLKVGNEAEDQKDVVTAAETIEEKAKDGSDTDSLPNPYNVVG